MAKKTFKGRVVLPGKVTGKATVSRQAFNTSGSYMENMFAGRTDAAPCTDANNKELFGELFGKDLSNAILCTSTTVGSTMGGMALMGVKAIGVGPQALLFSQPIDTLAAAGVLMADIWKEQRIVTIDMLGDEFLKTVKMGDPITIKEDGTVEVG
jgi:predicted aconitase with swiveling domain